MTVDWRTCSALHQNDKPVATDDASNWDLSTMRDGFMLGAMLDYQSRAAGVESEEVADFHHWLMLLLHLLTRHTHTGVYHKL